MIECTVTRGQAFPEKRVGQILLVEDIAGGEFDASQAALACEARRLIQKPVLKKQTLSKGVCLVRESLHDSKPQTGAGPVVGCCACPCGLS